MTLKYVSTRGAAPVLGFDDVLLAGLAADGGLYVPESWPALPSLPPGLPYHELALDVMWPFVDGTIDRATFATMVVSSPAASAPSPTSRSAPAR